ncbi:MAG: hypothetical protein JSU63_10730 [Phycisphaerales bacterium]|nr:MAG: hypothetical protein JSU63_10730 [Phycisphaerales bacterium]
MSATNARNWRRMLTGAVGVAMFAGTPRVEAAWTLKLANGTGETLAFYDVNESPPPSRLQAGTVLFGGVRIIDPEGYNPVFAWNAGINTTGTDPNGFLIAFALTDSPPLIQYKIFHYKVTPGQAGKDPDLQPILISQKVVEVTEGEIEIFVDRDWNATIAPPSPGACCALTGCSNVASLGACPAGNFLPGASCTPTLCATVTQTVGPAGGTVATPDGAVTVKFPPGCLGTDVEIGIEEGVYPTRVYNIELTDMATADFDVHMAYTFTPGTLAFCPDVELCMTFDHARLGLDPAKCSELRFIHSDRICGTDADSNCLTDADCPPDDLPCRLAYHEHTATCDCPATSPSGTCCTTLTHFSDIVAVSPVKKLPPCRRCIRRCCGRGIVVVLPLMLAVLGFARLRRACSSKDRRFVE